MKLYALTLVCGSSVNNGVHVAHSQCVLLERDSKERACCSLSIFPSLRHRNTCQIHIIIFNPYNCLEVLFPPFFLRCQYTFEKLSNLLTYLPIKFSELKTESRPVWREGCAFPWLMAYICFNICPPYLCFTENVYCFSMQKAFRTGTSTRLDDRVYAMCQIKCQPLVHLMKMIHPNLYRIDRLTDEVRFFFSLCLKFFNLNLFGCLDSASKIAVYC